MRRIFLFMHLSLDGYFEGPDHDLSWASPDFEAFSLTVSGTADTLLLGRNTYELMKGFWPTPQAEEMAPHIARFYNERRKVVASRTPFEPGWKNVTVISDDVVGEVKKLKEQPGGGIAILGSNELCVSLIRAGLIDEFRIMVNPVVLGAGTSLFEGLPEHVDLRLTGTHRFDIGTILLTYEPAGS